ncbi:MAG: hypothetical protein IT364_16710 [Candidatus Hydrogenedentes bacterium]|nr:hypothetical protein [Candidatus Hydrogenedentota bacterium]
MELALALGKTVTQLEREMPVAEFEQWYLYRHAKLLPLRRMEYYMAQLTLHVSLLARLWGGPEYSVQDFLFDVRVQQAQKQDTAETGAEVIGAMAGGVKVIRIGQKRKRTNG